MRIKNRDERRAKSTSMAERTLVIIKPDAIQRHLAGEIISRLERKGLKFVAAKFTQISEKSARRLYAVHKGKPFYKGLVKFICSVPVLVMVWEADGVVEIVRKMMGATSGYDAQPGTIRGDFSCSGRYNLIHGSDSQESAEREIKIFFRSGEIIEYELADSKWLYDRND